jgi:hypothetical protein
MISCHLVNLCQVAGALTMGTDFNALHEKEEHFFVKAIHAGFRFMNIVHDHGEYI